MDGVKIEPVTLESKAALLEFDDRILNELDAANPFIVSFAHDVAKIEKALSNPDQRIYFIVVDVATDSIIARCGIKLNPPDDDICAYGKVACEKFHAYPGAMASLIGDLVSPAARGRSLQSMMIDYRIDWLREHGFRYAVAGIIEGNDFSKDNYVAAGFDLLGCKDITWDVEHPFTSAVNLYGRKLCFLEAKMSS